MAVFTINALENIISVFRQRKISCVGSTVVHKKLGKTSRYNPES